MDATLTGRRTGWAVGLVALALVGTAQIDGLTGHLDTRLPVSFYKLLGLSGLALVAATLGWNAQATGRPRPSLPMAATALFALWLVAAYILAGTPTEGRDHLTGFLATLILVPILGLTVSRQTDLWRMALVIAASGALSGVCVILEARFGLRLAVMANPLDFAAWGGELRSAGASAYNPTTSAHLLTASLMLSLAMALQDARRRLVWLALAAPMMAALPLMGARSALLALVVGLIVLGWCHRRDPRTALAALVLLVAGLISLPFLPDAIWERFAAIGGLLDGGNTADRTLLRRLSYNLIGLDLWQRHPLTGVGPGGYPSLYASHEFRWYPGRELEPRQLHNSYLEILVETGIVGFALFTTAVFGALAMALRSGGGVAQALGVAFAAFLFASLFMPNEDNKFMWILTALCARAGWIARQEGAR